MKNALSQSFSPYLLQHQHNPVHWFPWSQSILATAKAENKLLIVSIGYSACHWCHVMEHEVFENEDAATLMNQHFLAIKVDREEHPDVDQVYMDALQALTGQGGWPLNMFCLPDGRPFYGGTYMPLKAWMNACTQIATLWHTQPQKVVQYAEELQQGLAQAHAIMPPAAVTATKTELAALAQLALSRFDSRLGGFKGAPKFPMPGASLALLHWGIAAQHQPTLDQIHLNCTQMALSGLYDQLAGGFARYAVDEHWKIPHFEKMLYDNAQLLSLYAAAYKHDQSPLYRKVLEETIAWAHQELAAPNGGYYAALDADSEGVEGKFYVWTAEALSQLLTPAENQVITAYFGINDLALWEHQNNHLLIATNVTTIAASLGISETNVLALLNTAKHKMLAFRNTRVRPGTDIKRICSWNALWLTGLCHAYQALQLPYIAELAKQQWLWLQQHFLVDAQQWVRIKNTDGSTIPATAEDYAAVMQAAWVYVETFADVSALNALQQAVTLLDQHFFDPEAGLYRFTDQRLPALIHPKFELSDNVIPSSNGTIALVLYQAGNVLGNTQWINRALNMLEMAQTSLNQYPNYHYQWFELLGNIAYKHVALLWVGDQAIDYAMQTQHAGFAYTFSLGALQAELPFLKDKQPSAKATLGYICFNNQCLPPVQSTVEAFAQLKAIQAD